MLCSYFKTSQNTLFALVDSLKKYVPRRKKQALRAKITALGQAAEKKKQEHRHRYIIRPIYV
jgi:hypothetical protein